MHTAENFTINPKLDPFQNLKMFVDSLKRPSEEAVDAIETATRGQSTNTGWYQLRTGRITASKIYRVHTKVNTLSSCSNRNKNTECLVREITHVKPVEMGQSDARLYGIQTEAAAIDYYKKQKIQHTGVKFENCGFFISKSHPFIGASPDLLVSCNCCGDGVVECKCPYSKRDADIHTDLPDYVLIGADGQHNLKRNHLYYAQVQTQLAVTGRSYCDFVVYSKHGSIIIEKILFDSSFWQSILANVTKFYIHYVVPELIGVQPVLIPANIPACKGKRKRSSTARDYVCPVCDKVCLEKPSRFPQQSIQCDECQLWQHFACVDIKLESDLKKIDDAAWYCKMCVDS